MRHLFIAFIALVLLSCQDLEIVKYEYHTTTMMGRTVLSVTEDSVTVAFNGRGEPTYYGREVKESEWEAVNSSMKDVDLSKVSSLEAPSDKRATDASPHAKFVFVGQDSSITTASFDAKNPHEMLMPLMQEIIKIQEENKK
ncbi:MAG: hypothetical protein HUJ25_14890 [Crocinitomicaceae bacterium]|nr:hypothetical protein [Crocinitomicaceae bacterium]